MATTNGTTHETANQPNGTPAKMTEAEGSTYGTINGNIGANGEVKSAPYGDKMVKELLSSENTASTPGSKGKDDVQLVLQTFRLLIGDLCQQFNMGHPG